MITYWECQPGAPLRGAVWLFCDPDRHLLALLGNPAGNAVGLVERTTGGKTRIP